MASVTPMYGDWWWHGEYYPTPAFYEQFANNGYQIDYLETGREHPNRNICARLLKISDKPFVMPDENTMMFNKVRPR